jgi:ribosomal protein S18 acetylase RimI-like enzyme
MEIKILETDFGAINYDYIISEKYPRGLLLFMGSYVKKEFRGQGKFKEMLKILFSKFPENTLIQVPLSNKKLVSLFDRLGFKKVKSIEYWGEINVIEMEGILSSEMIKKI